MSGDSFKVVQIRCLRYMTELRDEIHSSQIVSSIDEDQKLTNSRLTLFLTLTAFQVIFSRERMRQQDRSLRGM